MTATHDLPVRTRYAPSPTGLPHVGNMRNALYSWLLARHYGGQFLVRLEDTDRNRYDPASERAQFDALEWLGLDYDEGPRKEGPYGPYVQSERLHHYHEVIAELIERGAAYRCFCSTERLQSIRDARQKANLHPYGYDRHCRSLSEDEVRRNLDAGAPHVVRFKIPLEGETVFPDAVRGTIAYPNRELDDHVLLKTDGFPTYHLAHMVDDHLMRITHVIRSEEWLPSAPRHILQYQALGWAPPAFVHPGVIQGRDPQSGKVSKLSKRHGAVFVGEYREQGFLAPALVNFVALLGWSPGGDLELMDRDELVSRFTVEGINPSPSVFDLEKLKWMNGVYLRRLEPKALVTAALPFLQREGLLADQPDEGTINYAGAVLRLEQERLRTLAEAPEATAYFFSEDVAYDPAAVSRRLGSAHARPALEALVPRLQSLEEWTPETLEAAVRATAEELGIKAAEVIHPTRVATTGRAVGPGLYELMAVLGRERVLRRMRNTLDAVIPQATAPAS